MSNRVSNIPPFRGRLYQDLIARFPSWMKLDEPMDALLLTAAKETFLVNEKHLANYLNSFLPTADGSASNNLYIIESTNDFSMLDTISGEYITPVSGMVGLSKVLTKEDLFGCIPTRISHGASHGVSGENMSVLSASGESLAYVQTSPSSGVYYFSMVDDPSLYFLSEAYEIIASGELSMRHVEERLEFVPVTGDWYRATLSHMPDGLLELFDVYDVGISVNLDHSGTYVEAAADSLKNFGQLRARYDYRDFQNIHRITTDAINWNIAQERVEPAMIIEQSNRYYETIPIQFAESTGAGSVLLVADCKSIKPGERARVDFDCEVYVHQEESLSGIYQYDFTGEAHLDSLRIFSQSGTYGAALYYDETSENLYTSFVSGTVEVRGISPDDYYMEAGNGKITVYNNRTEILGPFHITYYAAINKRYEVFARQSYRRSSGDIDLTPFFKDYSIEKNVLIPKSILKITENDANIWTMLSSAPLEHFSVSVQRARKAIVHDPEYGNLWILQDNDILYNLAHSDKYDVQPRSKTFTHIIGDIEHEGWTQSGDYWYKPMALMDFEQPDDPYLLLSAALYDAYLGILAEKNATYYIILVSRFDPSSITVFPVVGGETLP